MDANSLKDSLKKLRAWFVKNAADLPWRPVDLNATRDPYAVWISETMLQQTQVSTVRDYFIRWMKRFPTVDILAKASEAEVFKYWQGLGYYSRARNILKAAKIICEGSSNAKCRGNFTNPEFPRTRKELEALPGIGAYTAGAILSLAMHEKEAILDGNLVRIFSRLNEFNFLPTDHAAGKSAENTAGKNCAEVYWDCAREVAASAKAYMHNEALMELGRTVCKVKNPECTKCPLAEGCRAFKDGRAMEFPPAKKHVQKDWHGTALVIESADGKIFAVTTGQPFLQGQLSLPHFESPRDATLGLPVQAEEYISADDVESVMRIGKFRHSITVHKIECDVLHIKLKVAASKFTSKAAEKNASKTLDKKNATWIQKSKVADSFANNFSLKALKLLRTSS